MIRRQAWGVLVGKEISRVVYPHPVFLESVGAQLGDHGLLPARQILQNKTQICLMLASHRRPPIRAHVLVTTDIGMCGVVAPRCLELFRDMVTRRATGAVRATWLTSEGAGLMAMPTAPSR
jgi:hypothetical protein